MCRITEDIVWQRVYELGWDYPTSDVPQAQEWIRNSTVCPETGTARFQTPGYRCYNWPSKSEEAVELMLALADACHRRAACSLLV
jgi:hypothetical protein